jgi:hypothetical protein
VQIGIHLQKLLLPASLFELLFGLFMMRCGDRVIDLLFSYLVLKGILGVYSTLASLVD